MIVRIFFISSGDVTRKYFSFKTAHFFELQIISETQIKKKKRPISFVTHFMLKLHFFSFLKSKQHKQHSTTKCAAMNQKIKINQKE